jgi:hypothetical protein
MSVSWWRIVYKGHSKYQEMERKDRKEEKKYLLSRKGYSHESQLFRLLAFRYK